MPNSAINTQRPVVHAIEAKIRASDFTASGTKTYKLGGIPGGSVYLRTFFQVVTAFTGGGLNNAAMIRVGTQYNGVNVSTGYFLGTANYQQTVTAGPFDGSTGLTVALSNRGEITAANFDVVLILDTLSTAPTAGYARVVVEFMPPVMNKENETTFDT